MNELMKEESMNLEEALSVALGNSSFIQQDDRNKTISFAQTLSTTLGEEASENSISTIDIFDMEQNLSSPSNNQNMKEPSVTDADDSSFDLTVDEETNDIEDPEKEIKSQLFYYLGGMGLFYVIGLISSCLCKLCGKENNNDMDAAGVDIANGADTAASLTNDPIHVSMSATKSQLGFVAAAEGGATTTVNSTVVANMAVSAASNTAMSAASVAVGMATVAATGGAVAAAATGVTVGTMTTVATVTTAAAAVVVGSGMLTGQTITLVQQFGCAGSDNIVEESIGRMKIGYRNQDLPSRTDLEDLFVLAYNTVSPGCSEAFQRGAISASLDSFTEGDFGVETLWTAKVSCSPYCPPEPLFGKTLEGQDDRRQLVDVNEFLSLFVFSEYLDDSYYNSSFFINDQCETNSTDCSVENTRNNTHIVFVQVLNASAIDSDSGEASNEVLETYYLNGDDMPSESPTADSTIGEEPTVGLIPTQEPTTPYPTFSPTLATMAPITAAPSPAPTPQPSQGSTGFPTRSSAPSLSIATRAPTGLSSVSPSADPSPQASEPPTIQPSSAPTGIPTAAAVSPSADPSPQASEPPTIQPSSAPAPTESPTGVPCAGPSIDTSVTPTIEGSSRPSVTPSAAPTAADTDCLDTANTLCQNYAVHAGTTITFADGVSGITTISGDIGVSPGTSITGVELGYMKFTSGEVASTADAADFAAGVTAAHAAALATAGTTIVEMSGQTYTPGTYTGAAAISIAGAGTYVTLDGEGDENAVFLFQAGTTLTTAAPIST
jgi:hypothetical protein